MGGWNFGGGIEFAFLTYWSARFEYDFYHFGSHNLTFPGATVTTFIFDPVDVNVKQWMHTFTFGISYRFGPGPVSTYY